MEGRFGRFCRLALILGISMRPYDLLALEKISLFTVFLARIPYETVIQSRTTSTA